MGRIHLETLYKTDARVRVYVEDEDGDAVTGATGTWDLDDSDGGDISNGAMSEEGDGWYYHLLADDLSVSPGDKLVDTIILTSGGYQCYGEYEITVVVDRR